MNENIPSEAAPTSGDEKTKQQHRSHANRLAEIDAEGAIWQEAEERREYGQSIEDAAEETILSLSPLLPDLEYGPLILSPREALTECFGQVGVGGTISAYEKEIGTALKARELGIESIGLHVDDLREAGDSPHDLGKVQVEATLEIGRKQATVFFQNDGDGRLSLGETKEANEDTLAALGRYPDEDENEWRKLTDILASAGIVEMAQGEFNAYLAGLEPEVTWEIYRPDAALGGQEFRAFLTNDDEVSIQSRTPEGDTFRSHGTISKEHWDGLGIAGKGDPSLISGVCARLDNGEELHGPERSNEPER